MGVKAALVVFGDVRAALRGVATAPVPEHVLEFAGERPLEVFAQHSGSGWLAFAERSVDGTLLRSHRA